MTILFQSAQFILTPQDYQPLTTCSLTFVGPKCGLQYQTILRVQPLSPLNGNLRNKSYTKKYTIMDFSNISLIQKKILWILIFSNSVYFVCMYAFWSVFFPVHIPLFLVWKYTPFFLFCFVFLLYLISFHYFFCFFVFRFCLNVFLTTPNSFN